MSLLFFVLYYLYLWLVVDLRLIYQIGGVVLGFPVFYRGWEFFREYAFWQGGLVDYTSAFLSQFFYIGWAGALVATVQAWLLWLCSGSIIRAINGRRVWWVCFIPVIGLLVIYSRYSYQFSVAMALLAALGFVCLYIRTSSKRRPTDLLVFLALSIILYAIAGEIYLLFAVLCAMYELFAARRWVVGLIYLAAAPVILQVEALLVFNTSVIEAVQRLKPLSYEAGRVGTTVICVLYLFLPVTVFGLWLAGLLAKRAARRASSKSQENELNPARGFSAGRATMTLVIIDLLLPFAMGVAAVSLSYNDRIKTALEVDYYACRRMWPEVLQIAGQRSTYRIASYAVNRALYHTGRLADDMCAYPQLPEALFLATKTNEAAYWGLFDTFFDLGQMNLAEYALTICMETYGEQPIILKRLALVNMVQGNPGAARVCLVALSKTLFDAGWAKEYLAKIERDPNLSTDKEVQQLRSMMPATDRDFTLVNENMLLDLLDKNRQNQMAFEYLMGFYLLARQLDKFAENLNRLDDFDYARIPRVYEEAILFYSYMKKTKVELHGREISPESLERFDNFMKVYIVRYGTNRRAAFNELARNYGDSYLLYCLYKQSGIKK